MKKWLILLTLFCIIGCRPGRMNPSEFVKEIENSNSRFIKLEDRKLIEEFRSFKGNNAFGSDSLNFAYKAFYVQRDTLVTVQNSKKLDIGMVKVVYNTQKKANKYDRVIKQLYLSLDMTGQAFYYSPIRFKGDFASVEPNFLDNINKKIGKFPNNFYKGRYKINTDNEIFILLDAGTKKQIFFAALKGKIESGKNLNISQVYVRGEWKKIYKSNKTEAINFKYLPLNSKVYRKASKQTVKDSLLAKYSNSIEKCKIIKENWGQFLGTNFKDSLYSNPKSLPAMINLKFDSQGCIYPFFNSDKAILDSLKKDYNKKTKVTLESKSFYRLFKENKKLLLTSFAKIDSNMFKQSLNQRVDKEILFQSGKLDKDNFPFIETWNELLMRQYIEEIKSKIKSKNIKKIVILVHGYNLPYSLTQIQYYNLIEIYQNNQNVENTLFLNVFWPSNDKKKAKWRKGKFSFKDKLNINLIKDFNSFTFKSYFIAISLRKILNKIELSGIDINWVSHSLGGNIIAATMLTPTKKYIIDYKPNVVNERMLEEFKKNELKIQPKSNNIFMNAPAMGGMNTFQDLDSTNILQKQTTWTIGCNDYDKVLNRQFYKWVIREKGANTRLGGNKYFTEITNTDALITNKGFSKNFKFVESGSQRTQFGHDFFYYLLQPAFDREFEKFIKTKF